MKDKLKRKEYPGFWIACIIAIPLVFIGKLTEPLWKPVNKWLNEEV